MIHTNQPIHAQPAQDIFYVHQYRNGKFVAVVAGLGTNAGTWDTGHSLGDALAHAAKLNRESNDCTFKVCSLAGEVNQSECTA